MIFATSVGPREGAERTRGRPPHTRAHEQHPALHGHAADEQRGPEHRDRGQFPARLPARVRHGRSLAYV